MLFPLVFQWMVPSCHHASMSSSQRGIPDDIIQKSPPLPQSPAFASLLYFELTGSWYFLAHLFCCVVVSHLIYHIKAGTQLDPCTWNTAGFPAPRTIPGTQQFLRNYLLSERNSLFTTGRTLSSTQAFSSSPSKGATPESFCDPTFTWDTQGPQGSERESVKQWEVGPWSWKILPPIYQQTGGWNCHQFLVSMWKVTVSHTYYWLTLWTLSAVHYAKCCPQITSFNSN